MEYALLTMTTVAILLATALVWRMSRKCNADVKSIRQKSSRLEQIVELKFDFLKAFKAPPQDEEMIEKLMEIE